METSRTREFAFGQSCFRLIDGKDYYKVLHVNGNKASLFWYVGKDPMFGSNYYFLRDCPNFIVRNVKYHKYLGKVDVLKVNDKVLKVDTIQGVKYVKKDTFMKNAVNSIEEWVGKEELERLQFNERINKADNHYINHCSIID